MPADVDVVVVGLGAAGSATLWQLARRGVAAVGLERFRPGHDRGSSHGDVRIIRTASFEGPHYVSLARRAIDLWRELEAESRTALMTLNGGLLIGAPDTRMIAGGELSASLHDVATSRLSAAELSRAHPQHRVPDSEVGLYQDDAGYLRPETCVRAAVACAERAGASVQTDVRVTDLRPRDGGTVVATSGGDLFARRVVVAAGAWTARLLPRARLPLEVERVVQGWFPVDDAARFTPEMFPVFLRELDDGREFYGFPSVDGRVVKIAAHHQGRPADPETLDRTVTPDDLVPVREFIENYLVGVSPDAVRASACMYTNSPDLGFILGEAPGYANVVVVSACSGHGFKFASAVGAAAADLAVDGTTRHDITAFSPQRFGASIA